VVKRILIVIVVGLLLALSSATLWVYLNTETIKQKAVQAVNNQLEAPIKVSGGIDITFLSSFPKISLVLRDVTVADKLNASDTLASLSVVQVSFNFMDIWNKNYTISSISVEDGFVRLLIDESGNNNFDILKPKDLENTESSDLHLNSIKLKNIDFVFESKKDKFSIRNKIDNAEFSGSFQEKNFIIQTELNTMVQLLEITGHSFFEDRQISGNIQLQYDNATQCYSILKNKLEIDKNFFEISGDFCVESRLLNLKAFAKGNDLQKALALLPAGTVRMGNITGNGNYSVTATVNGSFDKPEINAVFELKDANAQIKEPALKFEKLNISGTYNSKSELLEIKSFSFKSGKTDLAGSVNILNPEFTNFEISASGKVHYSFINALTVEFLELHSGTIDIEKIKVAINQTPKDSVWRVNDAEGIISVKDVSFYQDFSKEKIVLNVDLDFDRKQMSTNNLSIKIGSNDLFFEGEIKNYLAYFQKDVFGRNHELKLFGKLSSSHLNINDFLAENTATSKSKSEKNNSTTTFDWMKIDGKVDVDIRKLIFQDAEFANLSMQAESFQYSTFHFNKLKAEGMDGKLNGRMTIHFNKANEMELSLNVQLQSMNVSSIFKSFKEFDQTAITSKNLKGTLNSDIILHAVWDEKQNFKEESLMMQADLELKNGELIKLESLKALSGKLSEEQLEHIFFTDMSVTVTIRDRKIFIPKTIIKSNLLQLELKGTHTFDNDIDYSIVLNLKNLLAAKFKKNRTLEEDYVNDVQGGINIFISMKGNIDNPIIKYDKESVKQKIKEDFKQEKVDVRDLFKKDYQPEPEKTEDFFYYDKKQKEDKYLDWED
jgi:hypothetical protein